MSYMQFPSHIPKSAAMPSSQTYKPFWLTSNFAIPNYEILHPRLNNQIALIFYYGKAMDQQNIFTDFYKLCKDSVENNYGRIGLESAVKTWIRNSVVKLQRRREQIISKAVTTFQTEIVQTVSQVLFSIFWDLVHESRDRISCVSSLKLKALCEKRKPGVVVSNQCASSFFNENGLWLPRTSYSQDIAACIRGWKFLCLPFQTNNLAVSVRQNNPIDFLQQFWLTFCYRPSPTNSIHEEPTNFIHEEPTNSIDKENTSTEMTSFNPPLSSFITCPMSWFSQTSETRFPLRTIGINERWIVNELTESNLKNHNKILESCDPVMSLTESNKSTWSAENSEPSESIGINERCIVTELTESNLKNHNKILYSCDPAMSLTESSKSASSTLSAENSESSDSWSVEEVVDENSDDDAFSVSPGVSLGHRNPTMKWLESDSDDESVVFEGAVTEENCEELGASSGSLCFIDTDNDDDDLVMFAEAAVVSFTSADIYEDKSQGYAGLSMNPGYDNPCFEEEFRSYFVSSYMRTLNQEWNRMMLDIEDKPRQATKVSFALDVTVHCFEKTEENSYDPSEILDRMRFQRRITELNKMLAPFFTCEHRKEVERRNGFNQD